MVIKLLLVLMNEFWIRVVAGFDEWILVMVCTYHMYPHKEWFFNFEEFDGGVVYMGSGDVNYIIGMCSIGRGIIMIN